MALGLLQSDWTSLRIPIIAGLCANVLVTIAAIVEVAQGRSENRPALYLVLVTSILIALCYVALLYRHRGAARPEPDATARWLFPFFIFGSIAALATGLLGYFGVELFKPIFGMDAINPFIYRILALVSGLPPLLPSTLLFAPVILSVGCVVALVRRGR
jgi:hypothetical protein